MLAAKEYEVGPKGSLVDMLSDGWLVASEEALPYPLTGLGQAWPPVGGQSAPLPTQHRNHRCQPFMLHHGKHNINVFSLSADMFVRISMSTKEM